MAKAIGSVFTIVKADTSQFDTAFKKASKQVKRFAADVNEAGSFITSKFTGIAAAVGVGFSVAGLKNIAEDIDKTAKTADALKFTTEALIGLRHAAALAGVETDEFYGSLQTMIKNVGMASQGLGKAQRAIADLGLDAEKLARISPENQFKAIADAFELIPDATQRATDALQIFGDSGARMINVMQGGSAALEETQAKVQILGLSFSRFDAAKVEAMLDSFADLQAAVTGLAQRFIVEIAPYVTEANKRLTAFISSGTSGVQFVINGVEWLATTIAKAADLVDYFRIAWLGLKAGGAIIIRFLLTPLNALLQLTNKIVQLDPFGLTPQWAKDASAQAAAFGAGFISGLDDVAKESGKKIDEIWTGPSRADSVAKYFKDIKAQAEKSAKEVQEKAPKPQDYSKALFESLKLPVGPVNGTPTAVKIQIPVPDNLATFQNQGGTLIKAGTAAADAFGNRSFQSLLERAINRQIQIMNKQYEEARKGTNKLEELVQQGEDTEPF